MNLKYLLKKKLNIKTGYLIVIVIATVLLIGGYFSYALFTASSESKGALNIVTGNLYSFIESNELDSDKEIVVTPGETKIVNLKLTNVNGRDAKLNLYYTSSSSNIEIGYLASGDAGPTTAGVVLKANGTAGDSKTIKIAIKNNDTVDTTVKFGSDAGLDTAVLAFPNDKSSINLVSTMTNSNIKAVYVYNDTVGATNYCVTGEEATCEVSDCFKNKDADSCPAGTIFKYNVDGTNEKYFYVLHDDGDNITLQQRENTIRNVAWYADSADNTKGPLTILPQLEDITKTWINVNDQTYTLGTTVFKENAFTGCNSSSCTINTYSLAERTGKARMISEQEALLLGCTGTNGSCPKWMQNYLFQSTNYGGTVDDNTQNESGVYNYGYWLSSVDNTSTNAWLIGSTASLIGNGTINTNPGARAVVSINKFIK